LVILVDKLFHRDSCCQSMFNWCWCGR